MKGQLLCLPCSVRAAYDIATKATENEELQKKVIDESIRWLSENPGILNRTPTSYHTHIFKLAQKITGNPDPFKPWKKASNEIALKIIPVLEQECKQKPLKEAFRLAALGAICGNTIDFEVEGHSFSMDELEASLLSCLREDLTVDDTPKIMKALSQSRKVLYLLDNAGEIAFDKFFIKSMTESFHIKVWAVVKSGPILNDATMEDAKQVELGEVAEVITTGNDYIGLELESSSPELLKQLHSTDIIIAKGQGYYESVSEVEYLLSKPIVYLLRAKCIEVAKTLNVPLHAKVIRMIS